MNGWINPQGNTGGEGGGGTPSSITWDDIRNKPTEFTPNKHTHVITEIEDLEETINFLETAVENTDTALQDITILVNNKVDKVDGKELSSNDFTDELKEKLENISENGSGTVSVQSVNGMTGTVVLTKADINLDKVDNVKQAPDSEFRQFISDTEVELDRRVKKEVGKGLSTEDFTTELKEKLESLTPQEIEQLVTSVNGKIGDVVLNQVDIGLENVLNEKQLTQDDYITLNTAIDEVRALTHDKVDKEEGKGLSSNDFTKEFKDKLTSLPQSSEMVTSVNGFKGEVFLNHENIGLGNVRNVEQATKAEFDLLKDVVTDNETALLNKVDKKVGYGLSQENFTPAHKAKLEAIEGNGGGSTPPEDAYVASVNGRTGNVELTSQDVGLNHVLNEEQATKEEFDAHKIATNEALSKKVNTEEGKGLSSNDFTDELKTKLLSVPEDITDHPVKSVNGRTGEVELYKTDIGLENVLNKEQATKEEFNALSTTVSNKVDKVEGKGLSTNDFTNVDKQKLEDALTSDSGVTSINGATGDFTINKEFIGLGNVLNARQATEDEFVGHVKDLQKHLDSHERDLLNQLPSALDSIENKVDKEVGKGLSTNDFTNADKEKYDEYGATIASNAIIVNTHIANKDVHLTTQEKAQIKEISGIQETILSHNNLIENNTTAITSHIENLDVHMTVADREQLDSIKDIDFIDLETKANRVDSKVDIVEGMGLSSNDFTDEHLEELEQLRTDTISNETTINQHIEDLSIHVNAEQKVLINNLPELTTNVEALDNEVERILELLGEGGEVPTTGVLEVIKKGHLYMLGNEIFDIIHKNKITGTMAKAFVRDNIHLFESENFMYNTIEFNGIGQITSEFVREPLLDAFEGVFTDVLDFSNMMLQDKLVINGELVQDFEIDAKWLGNTFKLGVSYDDFEDLTTSNLTLGKKASISLFLDVDITAPNFKPFTRGMGYNITNNTFIFEDLHEHTVKFESELIFEDATDIKSSSIYVDLESNTITINQREDYKNTIFKYNVDNAVPLEDEWDGSLYIGIEPVITHNTICDELLRRSGNVFVYIPERQENIMKPILNNATMIHTLSMEMDIRPNVKFGTNELEKSIQAKQDTPLDEVALRNIVVINEGDSIDDIPLGTIVFKRMGE